MNRACGLFMKHFRFVVGFASAMMSFAASLADAGPNAGGTLILHANEAIEYSTDVQDYCGASDLTECVKTDSRVESDGLRKTVFFAIAAFPAGSQPRLSEVTFGLSYDTNISIVALGPCADAEFTTDDQASEEPWPHTGAGTHVWWHETQTALLTTVYWFAGYNYGAPTGATIAVCPHPLSASTFVDDSVPPRSDTIAGFGSLGFDADGYVTCPIVGACCFEDGSCEVTDVSACIAQGGAYQGNASTCVQGLCTVLVGACCLGNGECASLNPDACETQEGEFQGSGTACDPNPCPPVGACCLHTYCTFLTESECQGFSGTYQGNGVTCVDSLCITSGVQGPVRLPPGFIRVSPNPTTGAATVSFALPIAGHVSVAVFDAAGRIVRTLADGPRADGVVSLSWDGRDSSGRGVPGGVYFVRITTDRGRVSRPVVIAR